jgi:protein involved in polysaccharide export with SLBB domain
MDGQQITLREEEGRGGWSAACGLCLLAALFGVGCAPDHRIGLDEFMQMQLEAQAAIPAEEAAATDAGALVARQMGPYRVGPNDVLQVTLTGADPSALFPPVEVRVDRDGNVLMPIVGKIHVGNQELVDVENAIVAAYVPSVMKDLELVAHVEVITPETTHVLVHGAVMQPGLVPLRRTERNLLYAIVGAGGVSDMASGNATLRRIRRPNEPVTLNLTNPEQLRAALALEPLENGDIVLVDAAPVNQIIVGGLVNFPRPQVYPPRTQITALQAIAAAGGLRTDVTPREATLIRRMPNGADAHVRLDLTRMSTGETPNVVLAAGDILWVPETPETKVQDFINRNFFIRAGVNANVSYNVTGVEYLNRHGQQSGMSGGGSSLYDMFDPLGFLSQNTALNRIGTATQAQ